jgi:serine/threonine protein kinase/formylglycine-generating enzyme required for sulfatase activity
VSKSEVQQRFDEAEALLGEFLARVEAGEVSHAGGLDALLKQRPDLEPELRELWSKCGVVDQAFAADAARHAEQLARVKAILDSVRASASFSQRYAIETEIGRGGMGAVLRVVDHKLERPLAMKVILGQAAAARTGETPPVEPRQLARFLNEAKLTGQLDHPGIVPVHEVGVDAEGRAYFTMKLVKGQTLAEVFEKQSSGDADWSTPRVLTVIERVCEAMAFAHERGVIHRDLKPANIMVGDFGEVYVMDWGLARKLGESEEIGGAAAEVDAELNAQLSLTRDGAVLGTPAYMSPEQARGEIATLGPQSDVYSLGAMLYQLIAGTPPHIKKGERPTGAEVLSRVVTGPPKRLASPTTRPELIAICEKALAHSASERYGSVRELAQDLNRFVSGRTVAAFDTSAWAETKQWVRRNKALAGALGAVVIVSTVGAVVLAYVADAERQARAAAQANATRAEQGERAAAASAEEAKRNAAEAARQATAARQARDDANQRANDVLSLSAQRDLDELVAEADKLWPAHPEMIAAYEDWLRRANELINGRPADESKGIKRRLSLAEHKAKLAELRREARPLTDEERRAERESHPRYAELEAKQGELLWCSRMLGFEPWPSEADVEYQLAREPLPTDAESLNALARPLVDPAKPVYGQEMRALLLARRALACAREDQRCEVRDTLAWALFEVGRLDEALVEEGTALLELGGDALRESATDLEKSVSFWRDEELAKRHAARNELALEVAGLTSLVNERRAYEFEDSDQEWWHRQLATLVSDLEALRQPATGLMNDVRAEPFGWGVAKRYEFAKSIGERSVDGAEARHLWSEAIAAIKASAKYGGLEIVPQMGLLPIGMDKESGLWEFAHLQTGDPAVRGADGKLVLTEETGLVFVLIPGGTFWMGAQKTDPNGQNYDPEAFPFEAPVHEVAVSPYFLSKYECSQGQWERAMANNPSVYGPNRFSRNWNAHSVDWSSLQPVEHVNLNDCLIMLSRVGLELPSEAQWEYGTRAGTSSVYWCGSDLGSLENVANLADAFGKTHANRGWQAWHADFDDGHGVHSPIGQFRANDFGLHDVHGNVWEWCVDGYDPAFYANGPAADPVAPSTATSIRVARGGSFNQTAAFARSSARDNRSADWRYSGLGLRPARALRHAR